MFSAQPTPLLPQTPAAQLPLDQQLAVLQQTLRQNSKLISVLERAPQLEMTNWYLAAGAVVQTVWNVVTGRVADQGIKDYDLVYFDEDDLSWDAEDRVIQQGTALFADLDVEVEIRNQARVHLWHQSHYGIPRDPYHSVEQAIDSYPTMSSRIGIRKLGDSWQVYAPSGLSDLFNLTLRPNPALLVPEVYDQKSARWKAVWPELTVLPWTFGYPCRAVPL
jgi:uncharacterized protein